MVKCTNCKRIVFDDNARTCPLCGSLIDGKVFCPKCNSNDIRLLIISPSRFEIFVRQSFYKHDINKIDKDKIRYLCKNCNKKFKLK